MFARLSHSILSCYHMTHLSGLAASRINWWMDSLQLSVFVLWKKHGKQTRRWLRAIFVNTNDYEDVV
jgi:hypothetical protein